MKTGQELEYYLGALDGLKAVVDAKGSIDAVEREVHIACREVARITGEFSETVRRFEAATSQQG